MPIDFKKAAKWYELSAEQGVTKAQFNLAVMLEHGEGISVNKKMAFKWYSIAASQRDAQAMTNLGVLYAMGDGVQQDYIEAYKWGNLGGANGNENGAKLRDLLEKKMTIKQVEEAQERSRECIKRMYKKC